MENGETNDRSEFPESKFRLKYSSVKERLNALKRGNVPFELYNPVGICWEIEDILHHDEENNLSFLQNKIRKLSAGSELCKDVCDLHRYFSKLEIDRAVSEVLEVEKYEKIADRINSRKALEKRREKFFLKQALEKIRNSMGDETDEKEEQEEVEESGVPSSRLKEIADAGIGTKSKNQYSNLHEEPDASTNLSLNHPETMRGLDNVDDIGMSKISVGRRMTEMTVPPLDVTIQEEQRQTERASLEAQLLEVLENGVIEPPEDVTPHGEAEVPLPENDNIIPDLGLESLPPLRTSPPTRNKKLSRPFYDRSIIIPDYIERARRLNKTIVVERVQVYFGPPSYIESLRVRYLMNNTLHRRIRSSVLERLFARHLIMEKKPHTDIPVLPLRVHEAIEQERSHPLRSEAQNSAVFEISTRQGICEETGVNSKKSAGEAVPPEAAPGNGLEKLIGTPVSVILQREAVSARVSIPPPDPWLHPRLPGHQTPRVRSTDPPITPSWFQPTRQSPPDKKWREFRYVRKRLEEVWMETGTDEGATPHRILGEEWTKENMLTLLRIVDKLSLKKEVVIDGVGANIVIRPFQVPYVSEKQFARRFDPPTF